MCKFYPLLRFLALIMALSLAACSSSLSVTMETDLEAACPQLDPHPIGQSIAEQFDVDYKEVMDWFCEGESFEDILLALQTSELTDRPLKELLAMKEQMGWENVWKELDIVP